MIRFNKSNENDQTVSIFKKSRLNWNLKKLEDQFDIFKQKQGPKKIIKPKKYNFSNNDKMKYGLITFRELSKRFGK